MPFWAVLQTLSIKSYWKLQDRNGDFTANEGICHLVWKAIHVVS